MLKPVIVAKLPYSDRAAYHVRLLEREKKVRLRGTDRVRYLPLEDRHGTGGFRFPKGFGWLRHENPELMLWAYEVREEWSSRKKSKDYPIPRTAQVVCTENGRPLTALGRGQHDNLEHRFAFVGDNFVVVYCSIEGQDIRVEIIHYRRRNMAISKSEIPLFGRAGQKDRETYAAAIQAAVDRLHCGYDPRDPRTRNEAYDRFCSMREYWKPQGLHYDWEIYPRAEPWNGAVGPHPEPCRCQRPHYGKLVG